MQVLRRCGVVGAGLSVQKRHASKVITSGVIGSQGKGRGGGISKKYGWKLVPGTIAQAGFTLFKGGGLMGASAAEDDDETEWSIYPGLNTMRTPNGEIRATVDGVVRISKLPGTEGTAYKVFVWVDPHIKDFMTREMERHRHRANGSEFTMDEIEQRFMLKPRWTHIGDKEQYLPGWLRNPQWGLPKESQNYARQPQREHMRYKKTERETYEEADKEMFYDRMPGRTRSFAFGGKSYVYEGAPVARPVNEKPEFSTQSWLHPASDVRPMVYQERHNWRDEKKRVLSSYKVSPMLGFIWH